jgi:Fic family protein
MKFPPIFHNSEEIQKRLHELNVLNEAIRYIPVEPTILHFLREKSLLKSALYSARIEGNSLTIDEVTGGGKSLRHKEVTNINRALAFVEHTDKEITVEFMKRLHAMILDGISPEAGFFRSEESAVFNQAGIAVYLSPSPQKVITLLTDLSVWITQNRDAVPVTAAVAHIWFEKVHPFLDGNGRVGRVLAQWILIRGGYRFTGVLPFEEYLDTHRQEYYDALMVDKQDVTAFVIFFLNALIAQARRTLEELKTPIPKEQVSLLPRRSELFSVIRDHPMATFDFLHRRFLAVPVSTLHNDLKQLIKANYIKKLGSTRGVVYVPIE